VEGTQHSFRPIYNLSQVELATLHEYIDENLKKGFIWQSKFPNDARILFVRKKRWFFANVCRLLWIESTHHQKSIPFALDFKVIGPT
jgi:hypothetical protein